MYVRGAQNFKFRKWSFFSFVKYRSCTSSEKHFTWY
ncbi:unnamed protein product [Schistosoma curassoni]|uniref:Uncharacterized protein n=1 Tax=Schistosoma curassoni TaxID=6186 RepID=A0A183JMY1_9TREM|nr:unnamed protein product [Schistosoma curassoni]